VQLELHTYGKDRKGGRRRQAHQRKGSSQPSLTVEGGKKGEK